MNWEEAIELIERRTSPHPAAELLEAAQVLVAKIRKLNARKRRLVTVGDVTLSILDWGKKTGISDKTIYNRMKRGWPIELAVSTPNQSDGSKFEGKTLRQWSAECGLSIDCIYNRMVRGWSVADAVSKPKQVN